MIELADERHSPHRATWVALYTMTKILSYDGMSDEEEDVDRENNPVMRVGVVQCRRHIVPELKTIDKVHDTHPEFFDDAGERMPRVREGDRKVSGEDGFIGRPKSFYEEKWLRLQSSWTRKKLNVKENDNFGWPESRALLKAHEL